MSHWEMISKRNTQQLLVLNHKYSI